MQMTKISLNMEEQKDYFTKKQSHDLAEKIRELFAKNTEFQSKLSNITDLNLASLNLTILPKEFLKLTNLVFLVLNNNKFETPPVIAFQLLSDKKIKPDEKTPVIFIEKNPLTTIPVFSKYRVRTFYTGSDDKLVIINKDDPIPQSIIKNMPTETDLVDLIAKKMGYRINDPEFIYIMKCLSIAFFATAFFLGYFVIQY